MDYLNPLKSIIFYWSGIITYIIITSIKYLLKIGSLEFGISAQFCSWNTILIAKTSSKNKTWNILSKKQKPITLSKIFWWIDKNNLWNSLWWFTSMWRFIRFKVIAVKSLFSIIMHYFQYYTQTFWEKKFNMQDIGPAPNNFLQDLLKLCRTGIYKILKFKRNWWWEQ